jgi:hypothetical protein
MRVLGGIHPLYLSDVDPSSTPAFMSDVQRLDDILPLFAGEVAVDPASTRYQGEWEGRDVYLAVAHGNIVHVVSIPHENCEKWEDRSSFGNVVIGISAHAEEEPTLLYLPHGTDAVPAGWRALSSYVITR